MFNTKHSSIAVFGYPCPPEAEHADIVHAIDQILQNSDSEPRKIHWIAADLAFIDRVGVRIAVSLLHPTQDDHYTHLLLAVGRSPNSDAEEDMLNVSHAHLADRLVQRVKNDMPYHTIIRGETPENVDETLIHSLCDLLRQASPTRTDVTPANLDTQPQRKKRKSAIPAEERFDVILSDDVPDTPQVANTWLEERAIPTKPLRLTVHTMALSIMLYTAPLGAFLFTYSMLRDISTPPS